MEQPLITVIVPVYKVEQYLKRCVDSIVEQSYKNLEIILVDDGSPDRCGEMCEEFAKQDSRIRVIHKENGGLSSARNAGLDVMTGDYVGFVDSDDWIEPDMYERLVALAAEYQAHIVCCGIERCTSSGHVGYFNDNLEDFLVFDTNQAMADLPNNSKITNSLCDKLFHRDIFRSIRMTEGILYEDYDVMHRCVFQSERVIYTGAPFYKYFVNDSSITRGNALKKQYEYITAGKVRIAFYEENCKESVAAVRAKHIESALDIIYKTRKSADCKEQRRQLDKETRQMLSEYPKLPFTSNTKKKVFFFKISTVCYILFLNVFYAFRKRNNTL